MVLHYGVGFGGQGAWHNKHFETLQEAETFYNDTIARTITSFNNFKTRVTYSTKNEPLNIKEFRICNIKKDNTPGKIRQTVRLYQII